MLTRRALFKTVAALGLGAILPSKIFGETFALSLTSSSEQTSVPSSISQRRVQSPRGEGMTPLEIETGEDLLDALDCMELAERYGSFEKVGGYLGGFLSGTCLFCHAGDLYVKLNDFRCDECETTGTALDFFAKMEGITDEEAARRLAVLVESRSLQRRRNEQKVLWRIMSEASRYYHHLLRDTTEGEPGREWLEEQGFTALVKEKLYLGYFPRCRNGIRTELIEHLVARGYETDIVQSAILPAGYPAILLPVRDADGHCWGFFKSRLRSGRGLTWSTSLPGMQRLAPHLFERIVFSCTVPTISAAKE